MATNPPPHVERAAAFQAVRERREAFQREARETFSALVENGDWPGAIKLVAEETRFKQADIARALELPRSTISRWIAGSVPPDPTIEVWTRKILRLLAQ